MNWIIGHFPGIAVGIILLLASDSGTAATDGAVWDESLGSPLPFTWDGTNFDGFNIFGIRTEKLTVSQSNLAASQRTIGVDRLTYSTTAYPKRLQVVDNAFAGNVAAAAAAGLERTGPGQAFANGIYDIVNWQERKYVALNGKVDKLAKLVIEQGMSEKKILIVGETWNIGDGWALTAQSIDARATPRQVWFTLSKDGIKKDDRITSEQRIYTFVERSLAGETDVPALLTYVDGVFAGTTSDMVQLRYTWAISENVTQIRAGDAYGIFEVVTINTVSKVLGLNNTNIPVSLIQNSTTDLIGNIKFKVIDDAASLKFYPTVEPELNITASPASVPAGNSANVIFTVTSNGLPISGATVSLSGAAVGSGITGTNGQAAMNINASYIGTILAEAEKSGYSKGTASLQAAYSLPLAAMAAWNIQESYALNLIDIDAKASPRQARFQLLKNNLVVDDAFLYVGEKYYYNSSSFTIFTAKVDAIFSGTQGNLVKLVNVTQYSESTGLPLFSNEAHLYKSINLTGISWLLNESYELRMMDLDIKTTPRLVWLELLKNNAIVDDAILFWGQTYLYNNSTNSRVLESKVGTIFSGTQGNLVKLVNVTQYSESTGTPLFSNTVHLYKSVDFTGIPWQLNESYELRMMDIDVKASPRQVWLELLKNNILDDSFIYWGQSYYYNNSLGFTIFTAKVDAIFKGETSSIVKLKEVNQYSETSGEVLLSNSSYSFIDGAISRSDQPLSEGYNISALGIDAYAYPRLVWLRLYKNNTMLDEIIARERDFWYYNISSRPILFAKVDSIFLGATSNMVVLTNVRQYSELDGRILINDANYTIATTATQQSVLSPLVAPFDTSGDGRIQRNEAVICVVQFFTGIPAPIPRATAVAVVVAFFSPPV